MLRKFTPRRVRDNGRNIIYKYKNKTLAHKKSVRIIRAYGIACVNRLLICIYGKLPFIEHNDFISLMRQCVRIRDIISVSFKIICNLWFSEIKI